MGGAVVSRSLILNSHEVGKSRVCNSLLHYFVSILWFDHNNSFILMHLLLNDLNIILSGDLFGGSMTHTPANISTALNQRSIGSCLLDL